MASWLPLSPILALLLGALGMAAFENQARVRRFFPPAAILLSFLLLILNARQPEPAPLAGPLVLPIPDIDLRLVYSPGVALFAGLALWAASAWLFAGDLRADSRLRASFLVILAGSLTVICADNWVTMAAGWLLAGLGLLTWRLAQSDTNAQWQAWRSLGANLLGSLLLLAAAVLVLAAGSPPRLEQSAVQGWAATFGLAAAWLLSGAYPFHFGVRAGGAEVEAKASSDSANKVRRGLHPSAVFDQVSAFRIGDDVYGQVLALLMGVATLSRILTIYSGDAAFGELLHIVALGALGITTLLSLLTRQQHQKRVWAGMALAAPLWLVPFLPAPQAHTSITIWLGLGVLNLYVLMLSLELFKTQTSRRPWRLVIRSIAIASVAGFPLTPGFWGWIGLYAAALQGGQWLYLLLFPSCLTIALIPFWRGFLDENEHPSAPRPVQYAGLLLLVLIPVVEAIVPFFVVSLFGRAVEEGSILGYDALLRAPNLLQPIALLVAASVPGPLAFWLARRQPEWAERVERVPGSLAAGLDLSAFTRAPIRLLDLGSLLLRQATTLVEQHPLGWILFAALWVALWLFNVR